MKGGECIINDRMQKPFWLQDKRTSKTGLQKNGRRKSNTNQDKAKEWFMMNERISLQELETAIKEILNKETWPEKQERKQEENKRFKYQKGHYIDR